METLYFAYGSNLHRGQMSFRCPDAEPVNRARLRDWRLVFRGVADIEPARGSVVHGALWLLTPRCLEALDRYEGYPRLYDREPVAVEAGGQTFKAIVYRMTERHRDRYEQPSLHYLGTIARGYTDFGIKREHLRAALDTSAQLERAALLARAEDLADEIGAPLWSRRP